MECMYVAVRSSHVVKPLQAAHAQVRTRQARRHPLGLGLGFGLGKGTGYGYGYGYGSPALDGDWMASGCVQMTPV